MTTKARKPRGYWNNRENVEREALLFIEKHGIENFASHKMQKLGCCSLSQRINQHGGFPEWRKRLELAHIKGHHRVLDTFEDVEKWVIDYIVKHGVRQFYSTRVQEIDPSLYKAVHRNGGFNLILRRVQIPLTKREES